MTTGAKREQLRELAIDVWNDLPTEVKNNLETLGKCFSKAGEPSRTALKGCIEGYVMALQDTGVVTSKEGTLLDMYVKNM